MGFFCCGAVIGAFGASICEYSILLTMDLAEQEVYFGYQELEF
jgi:hypothetical protein